MSEEKPKVGLIRWNLLAEWWHADPGVSADEIAQVIHEHTKVQATLEQIKQRLFGGFGCAEVEGARHVYHAAGYYTYLTSNGDLSAEERLEIWNYLLENNTSEIVDRAAPFAEDCPVSV